jgi:hypothetical protein
MSRGTMGGVKIRSPDSRRSGPPMKMLSAATASRAKAARLRTGSSSATAHVARIPGPSRGNVAPAAAAVVNSSADGAWKTADSATPASMVVLHREVTSITPVWPVRSMRAAHDGPPIAVPTAKVPATTPA